VPRPGHRPHRRRSRRAGCALAAAALAALAGLGGGTGGASAESGEADDGFVAHPPRLESYAGRVVLVHFWATWCDPCVREIPALESFYREGYRDLARQGLVLLAVSNDVRHKDLRGFLAEHELSFPVFLDPEARLRDRLAMPGVPGTVVVGRDGEVVARLFGEQDWTSEDLRARLEDYVAP